MHSVLKLFLVGTSVCSLLTSLGNRDDCVCILLCYSYGGVRNLSQQVQNLTYTIVNYPPVSGKAPIIKKHIKYFNNVEEIQVFFNILCISTIIKWNPALKTYIKCS